MGHRLRVVEVDRHGAGFGGEKVRRESEAAIGIGFDLERRPATGTAAATGRGAVGGFAAGGRRRGSVVIVSAGDKRG
ncbi:MAG TPA: hypothetical protein VF729_02390 [Solirubrobacterales bacterium]